MFHIDPATLRRYPILGVLIGLATCAVVFFLVQSGSVEARALLEQKKPTALSLDQAMHHKGILWVTVSGGQWHCGDALVIRRRSTVGRWMWGSVEATEVPITVDGDEGLLVARFEKAVSCADRATAPLTGVVGSREIFTTQCVIRRWRHDARHIVVFNVDASPSAALVMLLGMGALFLVGVLFSGYYFKLMFQSDDRQPAPRPLSYPIEPS